MPRIKAPWILNPKPGELWRCRLLAEPDRFLIHWSMVNGVYRSKPCAGERCQFCGKPIPEAPVKAWYVPVVCHQFARLENRFGPNENRVLWLTEDRIELIEDSQQPSVGLVLELSRPSANKGYSLKVLPPSPNPLPPSFDIRPSLAQAWGVPMAFFDERDEVADDKPATLPFPVRKQA